MNKVDDALERCNVLVIPDTRIFGRDPAFGDDSGRFNHNGSRATDRKTLRSQVSLSLSCMKVGQTYAEMDEMPVCEFAVDSGILAHRGLENKFVSHLSSSNPESNTYNEDSVLEFDIADCDRGEEFGDMVLLDEVQQKA